MPFTPASVPDSDAYRAQVGHIEDCLERVFSKDQVHGVDAGGRPIKYEGAGWPPAELHMPPRLFAPNTVTAGGSATDEVKLVNYALAAARAIVRIFEENSIAHGVTLTNIAVGASAQATITAIRGEWATIVTVWNANQATIGVSTDLDLPTPPLLT